jgi:hypothetical protein
VLIGAAHWLQALLKRLTEDDQMLTCSSGTSFADIPLIVAAPLGLLGIRAHMGSDLLVDCMKVFHSYACSGEFYDDWMIWVHRDLAVMLLIWIAGVSSRIYTLSMLPDGLADSSCEAWKISLIVVFAINSLIVLAIASCVLFICRGMTRAVDSYCTKVIFTGSMSTAASQWNVVWATFRKASASLAHAMCVLEVTIFLILTLVAADVYYSLPSYYADDASVCVNLLVPGVVWTLAISKVFFMAAEVSDMCNRVPTLLNSCVGGEASVLRQSIVQYVLNCAAGFYLHEVKLTSGLLMKFVHFCAVAFAALVARFIQ